MDKKKQLIIAAAIVLVMAAVFVYFGTSLTNKSTQTSVGTSDTQGTAMSAEPATATVSESSKTAGEMTSAQAVSSAAGIETMKNNEKVEVGYNTPEYDLSLELRESSDSRTLLRMQYYLNGTTEVNELDEGNLPELAGIFEKRAEKSGGSNVTGKNDNGYRIKQALLNPVHSQLYLLIQG